MLRAFLPEPLIEFLVLEEQAILAGGLTPRRLNELRESWDTYGARLPRQDPACASRMRASGRASSLRCALPEEDSPAGLPCRLLQGMRSRSSRGKTTSSEKS